MTTNPGPRGPRAGLAAPGALGVQAPHVLAGSPEHQAAVVGHRGHEDHPRSPRAHVGRPRGPGSPAAREGVRDPALDRRRVRGRPPALDRLRVRGPRRDRDARVPALASPLRQGSRRGIRVPQPVPVRLPAKGVGLVRARAHGRRGAAGAAPRGAAAIAPGLIGLQVAARRAAPGRCGRATVAGLRTRRSPRVWPPPIWIG